MLTKTDWTKQGPKIFLMQGQQNHPPNVTYWHNMVHLAILFWMLQHMVNKSKVILWVLTTNLQHNMVHPTCGHHP